MKCPMCGLSGDYIVDDDVTPGKKFCRGCKVKFWAGGEEPEHDPIANVPLENKTGVK